MRIKVREVSEWDTYSELVEDNNHNSNVVYLKDYKFF